MKIKCPNCGVSHYQEKYHTATAMYCPPIIKDGVVISEDDNYYTTNCSCIACGYDFQIVRHKGKVTVK